MQRVIAPEKQTRDPALELFTFKTIFSLIYRDQFTQAYEKLDAWSVESINKVALQYEKDEGREERIFNLMKYLRYCEEVMPRDEIHNLPPGEESYQFWHQQWALFEDFIKSQMIYYESNYLGMKNYFYQKMIDNLILEFNSQSQYSPIMLETCKKLLEIGNWEKAEEGFDYLKKKAPKLLLETSLHLIELYHHQEKKDQAMLLLRNLLFDYPMAEVSTLPIPKIKELGKRLFLDGYTHREIQLWLPVFLWTEGIFPTLHSLEATEYKEAVIKLNEYEKSDAPDQEEYQASLVYRYLFILDQLYIRLIKGKTYLSDDFEHYLKKLETVNPTIHQIIQTHYESR